VSFRPDFCLSAPNQGSPSIGSIDQGLLIDRSMSSNSSIDRSSIDQQLHRPIIDRSLCLIDRSMIDRHRSVVWCPFKDVFFC
jgi:hypothetical protein